MQWPAKQFTVRSKWSAPGKEENWENKDLTLRGKLSSPGLSLPWSLHLGLSCISATGPEKQQNQVGTRTNCND